MTRLDVGIRVICRDARFVLPRHGWRSREGSMRCTCTGSTGFICTSYGWPCCNTTSCPMRGATAEWIAERPSWTYGGGIQLPNFGVTYFQYGEVENSVGTWFAIDNVATPAPQIVQFAMVNDANNVNLAYTTLLGDSVSAFSVTWNALGP